MKRTIHFGSAASRKGRYSNPASNGLVCASNAAGSFNFPELASANEPRDFGMLRLVAGKDAKTSRYGLEFPVGKTLQGCIPPSKRILTAVEFSAGQAGTPVPGLVKRVRAGSDTQPNKPTLPMHLLSKHQPARRSKQQGNVAYLRFCNSSPTMKPDAWNTFPESITATSTTRCICGHVERMFDIGENLCERRNNAYKRQGRK